MHLLKAIRVVTAIESSDYQQNAFALLAEKYLVIRMVLVLHRLFKWLRVSHLFVMLYGIKEFVGLVFPSGNAPVLGMGIFGNEVKHIDYLKDQLEPGVMENVRFSLINPAGFMAFLRLLLRPREVYRFLRFFRKLERNMNFMPACRLVGSLMMYVRFRHYLAAHPPKAVAYASSHGPAGCAVIAAAKVCNIKTIYIGHSLLSEKSYYHMKDHDLAVFDGQMMLERCEAVGFKIREVVYRGIVGVSRQINIELARKPNLSIGIFLTGFSKPDAIARLIKKIRSFTSGNIVIRGHPVDFSNPDMHAIAEVSDNIKISRGRKITKDIDDCDVVVAGNTTAMMEVLKHGVAVVYVSGLDSLRFDYNGLVKDGLIPGYDNIDALDMQEVIAFYNTPGWAEKFSYYDGAYGLTQQQVRQNVQNAVNRLIG